MFVLAITLFTRLINIKKMQNSKLIVYALHINAYAILAIVSYVVALLVPGKTAATILYAVNNVACLGIAYMFLLYAQIYAKMKPLPIWVHLFYIAVNIYYIVIFASNVRNNGVYDVYLKTDNFLGTFYAVGEGTSKFVLYYIAMYIAIGSAVVMFIVRAFNVAKIYRKKYTILIVAIFVAGVADCWNVMSEIVFDFSLISFSLIALLLYYYAFDFVPRGLLNQFISHVIKDNEDGYIFYDMFGRCQYRNKKAEEFYEIAGSGSEREYSLQAWLAGKEMQDIEEGSWEKTKVIDGIEHTYKISFRQLDDSKNNYLGCFFIMSDETEERNKYYDEWYKATHDELTGIYNREYFMEQVTKTVAEHPEINYCILCSDIIDFKMINDMFGIEKGDEVLRTSANIIKSIVQPGEIYGRIGGDRFAICMPYSRFKRDELENKIKQLGHMTTVDTFEDRIYFGVYENVGTDTPVSVICDRTIMAINKIKGNMQEHIIHYDEAYRKQVLYEQQLMADFNTSMRDRNFRLFLQPYVKDNGDVFGAEALVRWFHPIHGMMLPSEFVPVFEHTGLISRLDLYVWELACRQLRTWKELGADNIYISVNISARDFYYLDVYGTLTNLVEQHGIDAKNLHLEFTEAAVIQEFDKMVDMMNQLREYGFTLYMDDFGNGYSSLNALKDIPVDAIKIDMEFIRKSSKSERSRKIMNMIINLSNKIGIGVIAEGVETEDQMDIIYQMGCDLYQGYQFSKPITIRAFEDRYLREYVE